MATTWRFDESNPYEDTFEDALLRELSSSEAFEILHRKLLEIQRDPIAQDPFVVGGRIVHVAKTGAVPGGKIAVPPLLIAYTVDHRTHLIQPLFVCRAAIEPIDDELRTALGEAFANVHERAESSERRVFFPPDRTSIQEEKIQAAVRRALKRVKPR